MVKGYGGYAKAYQKSSVSTVDPHKMLMMLYDGGVKFLSLAAKKMSEGERYEAHVNLSKAKSIIAELLASLNLKEGGDIASNLQRLYTYMFNELIEANLGQDIQRVLNVAELLKDLRAGWAGIKAQPGAAKGASASANTPVAQPSTAAGTVADGTRKTIRLQG